MIGIADQQIRELASPSISVGVGDRQLIALADWNEDDHPRAENGRFGEGGGGKESSASTTGGSKDAIRHDELQSMVDVARAKEASATADYTTAKTAWTAAGKPKDGPEYQHLAATSAVFDQARADRQDAEKLLYQHEQGATRQNLYARNQEAEVRGRLGLPPTSDVRFAATPPFSIGKVIPGASAVSKEHARQMQIVADMLKS